MVERRGRAGLNPPDPDATDKGYFMPDFADNFDMDTAILNLVDEGFKRLDHIEADIRALMSQKNHSNAVARAEYSAFQNVDASQQLELITKTRTALTDVRTRLQQADFGDQDADEVCRILDRVKEMGELLAKSSQIYKTALQRQAESN